MSISNQQAAHQALPETPFFFRNGHERIFGILHRPDTSLARGRGFVFCHPCFEEKLWTHRVFVSLARDLAARGYHVLRFDFRGHGDSDGDFETATIRSRQSDLACAVDTLRQEIGDTQAVGLLGLRIGATLAAMHAEIDAKISHLVLWEPITEGAAYMQEVLLSNLATQSAVHQQIRFTREDLVAQMSSGSTVNIEGYELSHAFFEETVQLQLTGAPRYTGPCLIAQTGRSQQKPKKNLEALRSHYRQAELALCTEEPFWKEIKSYYPRAESLSGATLAWLQAND